MIIGQTDGHQFCTIVNESSVLSLLRRIRRETDALCDTEHWMHLNKFVDEYGAIGAVFLNRHSVVQVGCTPHNGRIRPIHYGTIVTPNRFIELLQDIERENHENPKTMPKLRDPEKHERDVQELRVPECG
jgi:hypothetical protein